MCTCTVTQFNIYHWPHLIGLSNSNVQEPEVDNQCVTSTCNVNLLGLKSTVIKEGKRVPNTPHAILFCLYACFLSRSADIFTRYSGRNATHQTTSTRCLIVLASENVIRASQKNKCTRRKCHKGSKKCVLSSWSTKTLSF